jgi:hypothetical protein
VYGLNVDNYFGLLVRFKCGNLFYTVVKYVRASQLICFQVYEFGHSTDKIASGNKLRYFWNGVVIEECREQGHVC